MTDRAVECRTCGGTHREDVPCPPAGRWLISGEPVTRPSRAEEARRVIAEAAARRAQARATHTQGATS